MSGIWPSLRRCGETGTRKPQSFAFGRGLGTAIVLTLAFWGLVAAFFLG